ncbi:MAG: carboxypeptidase-like regulatory domain-containing protein [Lentimicrobiaceae bacterium]|nr:carboxypeptidase-like regulatory domain-containing protein [Lentimicrobiaceae bacterium]
MKIRHFIMKHFLLISAVIFLCCATLHAQNRYFPLKGKVLSSDSLSPIPNVHILSEVSYYGTTSDFDGRFSMLIRNNDTLRISSVGFITQHLPINHDSINADNYLIIMQRDTIMLQEIDVFPYLDNHTVERIIRQIPIEEAFIIKGANENINSVLYKKPKKIPDDKGILSPIQSLYNRFNKKARFKRKLERNRKKYGYDPEL